MIYTPSQIYIISAKNPEIAKTLAYRLLENINIISNHTNSMKKFAEQPRILREILHSRSYNNDIKKLVKFLN